MVKTGGSASYLMEIGAAIWPSRKMCRSGWARQKNWLLRMVYEFACERQG